MKSATAISFELDDMRSAAAELSEGIRTKLDIKPGDSGAGILFGQPETEIGELSLLLSNELGIPIIGGTTAGAATLTNEGRHQFAVTLHVMTASDCCFAAAISEPLDAADDPEGHIADIYETALDRLRKNSLREGKESDELEFDKPKIVIVVAANLEGISTEDCLKAMSDATGEIPVFGFLSADDFEFEKQQVYFNGICGGTRAAILLISGNVKPVFETRNLARSRELSKRKVTRAKGNVIYEIDGRPAYEYIKEFPFVNGETDFLWNYQFFVETPGTGDDAVISRALQMYDKESGEIYCLANVPEGSYISLLFCDDEDVKESCAKALTSINAKIDGADGEYEYSTMFVISCSLRSIFLADQKNAEGDLLRESVLPGVTASGVYAFGELAPTSVHNGKAVNRFHHATITICAM